MAARNTGFGYYQAFVKQGLFFGQNFAKFDDQFSVHSFEKSSNMAKTSAKKWRKALFFNLHLSLQPIFGLIPAVARK